VRKQSQAIYSLPCEGSFALNYCDVAAVCHNSVSNHNGRLCRTIPEYHNLQEEHDKE